MLHQWLMIGELSGDEFVERTFPTEHDAIKAAQDWTFIAGTTARLWYAEDGNWWPEGEYADYTFLPKE